MRQYVVAGGIAVLLSACNATSSQTYTMVKDITYCVTADSFAFSTTGRSCAPLARPISRAEFLRIKEQQQKPVAVAATEAQKATPIAVAAKPPSTPVPSKQEQKADRSKVDRSSKPELAPSEPPTTRQLKRVSSGSGFAVNDAGDVLTNHHVIDGCREITIRIGAVSHPAKLVASDKRNDLAIMHTRDMSLPPLPFRGDRTLRPAEPVVAAGYPYAGLLASTPQVTTGTVTALAGLGDDTRYVQISTPIQPGNSGGPLLDQYGTVAGVIVSTINAIKVASATGSLPQNINFAIKSSIAREFLDSKGIAYRTLSSAEKLDQADVGDRAYKAAVLVECFQ